MTDKSRSRTRRFAGLSSVGHRVLQAEAMRASSTSTIMQARMNEGLGDVRRTYPK